MAKRAARVIAPLLMLAALLAPSVAPLLDHHSAEWQPGHRHIFPAQVHVHVLSETPHGHAAGASEDSAGPLALYFFEAGADGPVSLASAEAVFRSFILFEPQSLFQFRPPDQAAVDQAFISSPDEPPQLLA